MILSSSCYDIYTNTDIYNGLLICSSLLLSFSAAFQIATASRCCKFAL